MEEQASLKKQVDSLQQLADCYKVLQREPTLEQAGYWVVNKLVRLAMKNHNGTGIDPAIAACYNLDTLKGSKAADQAWLEEYLALHPELELGISRLGAEFSKATHAFTLPAGLPEGCSDRDVMQHLRECLEQEYPSTFPDRGALDCVLECLEDLSLKLKEELCVRISQ
jgi:hypothetical protein